VNKPSEDWAYHGGGSAPFPQALPITTLFDFPGWKIERTPRGLFRSGRPKHGVRPWNRGIVQVLAGGEVRQYTELLEDSRRHAVDRMIENAQLMGANAIIGMRFDSSEIGQSLTEIVAYGTAVVAAQL
jgi:hypothetical protein